MDRASCLSWIKKNFGLIIVNMKTADTKSD